MNTQNKPEPGQIFEHVGYYEEVWDPALRICLGTRRCEKQPKRPMGYHSEQDLILTETIELSRGPKTIVVQASAAKPRKLMTRYFPICGRMLNTAHEQRSFE